MMKIVSSSGRPRKTVEKPSPKARSSMESLRLASATRKPSARPTGSVATASRMVSQAPARISSPQPVGPIARRSRKSDMGRSGLYPVRWEEAIPVPCKKTAGEIPRRRFTQAIDAFNSP